MATELELHLNTQDVKLSVNRLDAIQEPQWMSTVFQKTSEGYLKGRAIFTNVGVFTYKDSNGQVVRDLRLPEEVFAFDSLKSMEMLPITLNHPNSMVDIENIKTVQVGYSGNSPSSYRSPEYPAENLSDGLHVSNDIVITDLIAIEEIEKGKRGLSCGYVCDLEKADEGSKWCGISYDYIQRNIRYNHIAIVDKARAGDAARIRLDSAEVIQIFHKEGHMDLKTIKLDGVEYQAEAEVVKTINMLRKDNEDANTKIKEITSVVSRVEAERDTLKDANAALESENVTLKANKIDEAEIQLRVQSLTRVQRVAEGLSVEIKDGMSEINIMKEAVKAKFPKANFDGKDEVYVRARFDAVAESIEDDSDKEIREVASTTVTVKDSADVPDANQSRQKMLERMRNASKTESKSQ